MDDIRLSQQLQKSRDHNDIKRFSENRLVEMNSAFNTEGKTWNTSTRQWELASPQDLMLGPQQKRLLQDSSDRLRRIVIQYRAESKDPTLCDFDVRSTNTWAEVLAIVQQATNEYEKKGKRGLFGRLRGSGRTFEDNTATATASTDG